EFERVEVALPTFFTLADLARPAGRDRLRDELRKARAFRVELTCRDATRAFGRLRPALEDARLRLVIEETARKRLRERWKTDYALFSGARPPADLVNALRSAAQADREGRFDGALVVKPISSWDRKELTDLLGADPFRQKETSQGPLGTDVSKSLADLTERQVTAVLTQAGTARPSRVVATPAGRLALGVPLGRPPPRARS